MTDGFTLDARLAADTEPVAELALCRVRLVNDARFPWLILVPARPGLSEWHDVAADDAARLWDETARAARALETLCAPEKINIGALGNIVRQLHIHVVARRAGEAEPYAPDALAERRAALAALLAAG
jgi:diadenosine tetraphosphate (Ap4A) HIT family hydrolase